jgi:glycosyltransferase involved in cell wall biosynthesis
MKILWFVNNPTPAMVQHAGRGGEGYGAHWTSALLDRLVATNRVELCVAAAYPGMRELQLSQNGTEYRVIAQPPRFPIFRARHKDIMQCAAIVRDFRPDLIHIHGSERFYGLIKSMGLTDAPVVLSLQGLLGSYARPQNYFGALWPFKAINSIRLIELPVRYGKLWQWLDYRHAAVREAKMLAAVDGMLGRTEWDHAHAQLHNPVAAYRQVGEVLRPEFYEAQWALGECERHTLIFTNAGHPIRGTENLLEAVALLRKEFPDIRLRLAGRISERSGYGRSLRRHIHTLGLQDRVELLGYLDGARIVNALKSSHAFVISSYIENSPNSLCEAQLIGIPCVASFVGGIPSLVEDGTSGLLYPVNDVVMLARQIRRIFSDDALAMRMAAAARAVAQRRHDPELVVAQLLAAYHDHISRGTSSAQTEQLSPIKTA